MLNIDKTDNQITIHSDEPIGVNEFYNDDELFWNDLTIKYIDGWIFLYDANTGLIGRLTDHYGYDLISEICSGQEVTIDMEEATEYLTFEKI